MSQAYDHYEFYQYVCRTIEEILGHNRSTDGASHDEDMAALETLRREVQANTSAAEKCLPAVNAARYQLRKESWSAMDDIQAEFASRERSGYPLTPQQMDHYIYTHFNGGC